MKKTSLLLLIAFFVAIEFCAQPHCQVKTFNLRDGLASNVITGIRQTEDGLMWFTTWSGLASYDGYRFTNYGDVPDKEKRVLTTNRLMELQPSSTGNIWCVTYDQNPFLFDRTQGRYVDVMDYIRQHYGVSFKCSGFICLKNGHTWLLSVNEGYVACIDDANFRSKEGIRLFRQGEGVLQGKMFNWIYEDGDGEEWMVTHSGIIRLKDGWTSKIPYIYITHVGKKIFMATREGQLGWFDKDTGRLTPLGVPMQLEQVGVLKRMTGGKMVVTTDKGLLFYDLETMRGQMLDLPDEFKTVDNSRSLYEDTRGNLWMTYGDGEGVMKVSTVAEKAGWSVKRYPLVELMSDLTQSRQTLFSEDREGTLWIATTSGFFGYYDECQDVMCSYPLRTDETQPYIDRWMMDHQGNLWFSNNHNLAMVQFKRQNVSLQTDASEVRSVLYDRHGRLWTGFRSGKLSVQSKPQNPASSIKYLGEDGRLYDNPTIFTTHIYSLFEDSQGNIWIGSKGDGLYRLTPEGRLTHYTHNPADSKSICSNQIYDVYEDHQGRIWIGTFEKGISLFSEDTDGNPIFKNAGGHLLRYPLKDFHKVRRITETADSTIIVSASNGMVVFKDDNTPLEDVKFFAYKHVPGDPRSLLTSDVMQTLVASDGTIYVATVGGGLQRMQGDNLGEKNTPLVLENISHLVRNCGIVFGLAEDTEGNIWIGCENSLNMYDVKRDKVWCYGPEYLGEDTRLAEALPAYNFQTDAMALATSSGTVRFKCQKLQEDSFVPSLVFGSVQFHRGQEGDGENPQALVGDSLYVPADRRNLTLYFAALDYQDNHMIRYAYMLEGIDREWNHLGRERSISWNDLPHGNHRLLVRSTNAYGTWVDNTRTLHLFVQPTFWESWWGRCVQVLILVAVIILAVWIYRMRTRAEMQRKLDVMKLEFFSDISHKLRTPLTLIGGPVNEVLEAGGLSDMAQGHLEMVKRNASRMLEMVNKMLTYSKGKHNYISDENVGEVMQTTNEEQQVSGNGLPTVADGKSSMNDKPHLLVVEDNDDLRDFLASILESEYEVTQAVNGREGLEKARAVHPDFILTDVMMPEMDGMSMVRQIKDDASISHIPIVILSAKASMDDRIEGLKLGVNDYITKPFSATYLKQRMANIISNLHIQQQNYLEQIKGFRMAEIPQSSDAVSGLPAVTPSAESVHTEEGEAAQSGEGVVIRLQPANIVDADKQMMENLLAYIDEHISNPELKIEDLASAVCLGRTVFYSKVRKLLGISPVELLRQIRIQRAEELVAKSKEPYSRIAYAVGFNDPRYFGKCFKAQTGLTPSEYRERSRMNQGS